MSGEEADMRQWWLVYLRWDNGHRETVRTTRPDELPSRDRCVVLAALPEARMTVLPGKVRKA
jgi:hypothetical protein